MAIRQSAEDYLETILVLQQRLGQVRSIDIVNELERMGDFIINISQDLERAFIERN